MSDNPSFVNSNSKLANKKSFQGATSTSHLETVVEKKKLESKEKSNGLGGVFSPKQLTINLAQKQAFQTIQQQSTKASQPASSKHMSSKYASSKVAGQIKQQKQIEEKDTHRSRKAQPKSSKHQMQ